MAFCFQTRAELGAARLEFLLLFRNKLEHLENHYSSSMPSKIGDYLRVIRNITKFKNITQERIQGKKHFQKWIWMLACGDERIFGQLIKLRKLLNYSPDRYLWYADKAQEMFSFLSEDIHAGGGRMLDIQFVKKEHVREYISYLSEDLQKAATIIFLLVKVGSIMSST